MLWPSSTELHGNAPSKLSPVFPVKVDWVIAAPVKVAPVSVLVAHELKMIELSSKFALVRSDETKWTATRPDPRNGFVRVGSQCPAGAAHEKSVPTNELSV